MARRIDRLLNAARRKAGVKPAALCDDATFLRRVSLDLMGRIPTVAETRSFLADRSDNRRGKMVDRLLTSPLRVRHQAALLRQQLLPQGENPDFEVWLQRELNAKTGYDKLVRTLLTQPLSKPQRPAAAAFLLVDGFKPEVLGANTARIFLGLNLDCAQCHDHPFARWKKKQFWQFAAFFARPDKKGKIESTIPATTTRVAPALPDESKLSWPAKPDADTGRMLLAEWITDRANPYFARNLVNRVWAQLLGRGLVEPLDDLSTDNKPVLPEVLDELARGFIGAKYDMDWLLRTLVNTNAYQLSSTCKPGEKKPPPSLFARWHLRPLSGEQLYDSLVLAGGLPAGSANPRQRDVGRARFVRQFQGQSKTDRSILQALELMNGPLMREIVNGKTVKAVAAAPFLADKEKIETLYLAALSRKPTTQEWSDLTPLLTKLTAKKLGDLFWVLLNSTEFSVNH